MNKTLFGLMPFIPGKVPTKTEPLWRYLPPVPEGVTSTWLEKNIPKGSWILDPFCASPRVALEAAIAGYRVLVTANNPITRFMLEMMANPPKVEALQVALADLSASYVGNERTEPHIQSLYNTYCSRCGQIVSADYFLWEHGNPSPMIRSYSCPNCGDSGEHPCTPYDVEISSKFSSSGIHKARALERVVASADQDRIHVEQALSVYIPRALYALITIINKIEGLKISPESQKYLRALLLHTFDQSNAMWKDAFQKERRRQLTISRHFRESNIWCLLEEGINLWSQATTIETHAEIPITYWPEIPPSTGGISIFEGRFNTIADSVKNIDFASICTALPRPNQAFWTLSALWAGWLWGREAVGTFKSVLRRQRYDWAWQTNALSSVFKQLNNSVRPGVPILGLISEAEPGFICAAMVAAAVAGCRLENIAIRPEEDQAQILWKCEQNPELTQISPLISQIAAQSAKTYLEGLAEPACYLNTITSAFMGIEKSWSTKIGDQSNEEKIITEATPGSTGLVSQAEPTPSLIYTSTYNATREALSYRSGFLRYNLQEVQMVDAANKNQAVQSSLFSLDIPISVVEEDEEENLKPSSPSSEPPSEKERPTRSGDVSESSFVWLREYDEANHTPLTDSYEVNLVNYLVNHPNCTIHEVDQALCELFPGLFTPDLEFVHLCLESYAAPDPSNHSVWNIRQEDHPIERQADLANAMGFLSQIGERLGFDCHEVNSSQSRKYISWLDKSDDTEYWFYPTISAAISEIVLYGDQPPKRAFIVVPGSRANLLIYKLRRDPRMGKAFNSSQGDWRFLKFRHLRSLAESPILDRQNLDQLLGIDPITYSTPQIWLI